RAPPSSAGFRPIRGSSRASALGCYVPLARDRPLNFRYLLPGGMRMRWAPREQGYEGPESEIGRSDNFSRLSLLQAYGNGERLHRRCFRNPGERGNRPREGRLARIARSPEPGQHRLRVAHVPRLESLGEPPVHVAEKRAPLGRPSLLPEKPCKARGRA